MGHVQVGVYGGGRLAHMRAPQGFGKVRLAQVSACRDGRRAAGRADASRGRAGETNVTSICSAGVRFQIFEVEFEHVFCSEPLRSPTTAVDGSVADVDRRCRRVLLVSFRC